MKAKYLFPVFPFLLWFMQTGAQMRGELLSDTLIYSLDRAGIEAIYDSFELAEVLVPIDFEAVAIHRIIYRTLNARGDDFTEASGLVTMPVITDCELPLLNYNHGSLLYDETLSEFKSPEGEHYIGVPLAANGYVVALPDYLGFGATPLDHPHTYLHAQSEATAVVDMLRATRQLCALHNVQLNNQLFLLGYSQGGHTTMAAHRALQEDYAGEFTVTASAPCSGPYDLSGITYDSVMFTDKFSNPFFIAQVSISYQFVYQNLYSEIGEIFQPPYDSLILRLLNRTYPESHLLDSLPTPGTLMFQPGYLAEMILDSLHPFRLDIADNDLYDWAPEAPVHLYYCTQDEKVPYTNAVFTAAHMASLGADVQAYYCGDFNHLNCTPIALIAARQWFESLRQSCLVGLAGAGKTTEVQIAPNPFYSGFFIELSDAASGILRIYNTLGQLLYATPFNSGEFIELPVQLLPPGAYVAEIQLADRRIARYKIVRGGA